jgi:uncharacterized protein involved in exopolysaccharide biosynthesis
MWNAIYRKLWILILLPLSAGAIAYFITGKKSGQYRSVAVIEASIPDPSSDAGARTLKDIPEPDAYYENMVATMKTEVITSMASYRLLLHDLEKDIAFRPPAIQYSQPRNELIRSRLEKKLSSFELLSESDATEQTIFKVITNTDYNMARWIRDKEMKIERRPGSNEVAVICSTEDPFLSAFAANALAQEYIRYETAMTSPLPTATPSNDSIGWYRDEVERLRKDLEQKTGELNEAGTKSPKPGDDALFRRAKANKISEFEMRIVEEEWEVNNLREQLAKAQRPEPAEVRTSTDVATNAKIQTIKKKVDQLSRIYAEGGSKDKQLDSIITRLRKQVNDETLRLQAASQRTVASDSEPSVNRNRDMIETRIRRHEESIASLRNDIRRLKNTNQAPVVNRADMSRLEREQQTATTAYTTALANLRKAEAKQPVKTVGTSRASHHLILKEKALPSAEPESPWAMAIVLSVVVGTLTICLIVIAVTRPAPQPYDDIFLKVNYSNQRRKSLEKKRHPHEGDVSLSNN